MAINVTAVESSETTSDQSSPWTPSETYDPTDDRFVIAVLAMKDGSLLNATPFSISGGGITTWRKLDDRQAVDTFQELGCVIWYAKDASAGSGTITITWGGGVTIDAMVLSVFEVTGMNTDGNDGAGAIRAVVNNAGDAITGLEPTMASYGSTNNGTVNIVIHGVDEATTQGTGFTEIHDLTASGTVHDVGLSTSWRTGNATTYGGSWTTSGKAFVMAIEIVEASEDSAISGAGELDYVYVENNAEITSIESDWLVVAALPGGQLAASTRYLILPRLLFTADSNASEPEIRVRTADDADVATRTHMIIEPQRTGNNQLKRYFAPFAYTTGSTPETLLFEYRTSADGDEVTATMVSFMVWELVGNFGVEGTDWHEVETAPSEDELDDTTPDTTVLAQLSGSDLGTDEWLIFGYGRADDGDQNDWHQIHINACFDEATATVKSRNRAEGEDISELRITGFAIRHKASSGTPNVTIYGFQEDNGLWDDGGGFLIALPTSAFEDFEAAYTAGSTTITATVPPGDNLQQIASYVPTTNGNHLVFGHSNTLASGGLTYNWIEAGGTEIRTDESNKRQTHNWDSNKDEEQLVNFQRLNISGSTTLDLEGARTSSGDVEHRWLLAISLAAAATGDATATPSALQIGVTFDSVSMTADSLVSATALAINNTFDATTRTASANATTVALAVAVTFDQPGATADSLVSSVALAVGTTFDQVVVTADSLVSATSLAVTTTFDQTNVFADAPVSPTSLAVAVTFDPVVAEGAQNATASPSALQVGVTFDATTRTASAVATTTSLSVGVTFDAAVVSADSLVTAAALAVTTTFNATTRIASADATTASFAIGVTFDSANVFADAPVSATALAVAVTFDPVVAQGQSDATATPAALQVGVTFDATTRTASAAATTSALAVGVTFDQASVFADAPVSPTSLAITVAFDPVVAMGESDATATPTALQVGVTFDAANVRADADVATTSLAVGVTFDAAVALADSLVTATALAVTVSFDQAVVFADADAPLTALAVSVTFDEVAESPQMAVGLTALPLTVTFDPVVATGGGDATATPSALQIGVTFDSASVTADADATTTTLVVGVTFDQATVFADADASLTALVVSATFDQVALTADAAATTSTLAIGVTFDAVIASAGARVLASALTINVTFDTVVLAAGSTVSATALPLTVAFDPVVPVADSLVPAAALAVTTTFDLVTAIGGDDVSPTFTFKGREDLVHSGKTAAGLYSGKRRTDY